MNQQIEIGERLITQYYKPYVVAEIGINHNGDMRLCEDTIYEAYKAGADAVKFQNYKTDSFIGQRSEFWSYINDGKEVIERQFDMFKRCELSFENLHHIAKVCNDWGIGFHSTPMCKEGLDELVALDVQVLKNGSDCLQDLSLVREMGRTGLPTVISTGMAKISDIALAVETFKETHNKNLILLHCTSSYPAPDESINIHRIKTLRDTFGCLTGFSDHSQGISAAILAVSQGAVWIEKHFTLSKTLSGPDHRFSADPKEMKELVDAVTSAHKQMGDCNLGMTKLEQENRRAWFR